MCFISETTTGIGETILKFICESIFDLQERKKYSVILIVASAISDKNLNVIQFLLLTQI